MEPLSERKKSIRNKLILLGLFIIAVALLLTFASLKKQTAKYSEINVNQTQQNDPNRVEVKGQLISTFPKFPVYPGAKIIKSIKLGESPTKGFEATWQTNKSVPEVMAWYLKNLEADGWKIIAAPGDPKTDGEQGAIFTKDKIKATINIDKERNNETIIEVNIPE